PATTNSTSFSPLPATTPATTPEAAATTTTNKGITTTNPFLNNNSSSQLSGNLQNPASNKNLTNYNRNSTNGILSQNTNNDSILSDLFNSTANSVVDVTAFNSNNHSLFKTGSGFVYQYNGKPFIITASNLVVGKNDITVTLYDGSTYDSKLTGYDPLTTLALLSTKNIPQNKLTPLNLANTTNLKVGQAVIAIGNTRGFSDLLTTGIISGLGKSIPTFGKNISGPTAKIPGGIITNLNVDSGYGGSPLLDIKGQVIGMNIGNFSNTNESKNTGISFAVPSNSISKIIPSLLSKGFYSHPWLGAYGVDVNLDIARALHLNETKGFMVIAVANSSPAQKAGILGGDNTTTINGRKITLGGDIILKIDNKNIQNINDMSSYIENKKNIGDDMLVTLLRNGIIQLIHVHLGPNPNYFLPLK
ncbi:MAG TPA: trypsin-like peptidase domain-containing protein, partial [Candidatus Sulfopaludibacter sp.]|nr:trypsin-like peptidase domain-containing protein [Candidatus Sulfopaludibacter sp.]